MKLTQDHLRAVGEALYGPNWQTPLSEALGVADRTVRRWAAGDFEIPDGVWADIGKLCRKRGLKLEKLACDIQSHIQSENTLAR